VDAIEIYDRCMSGRPYSKDLKIYTKKFLQRIVEELVVLEEYEKCIELNKFIEKRFNHQIDYLISVV
jgi:hypothetical protein